MVITGANRYKVLSPELIGGDIRDVSFETDMTALMKVLQDETFKIMEKAARNEWTPEQIQNEMKLLLGADNMGLTEYFNLF